MAAGVIAKWLALLAGVIVVGLLIETGYQQFGITEGLWPSILRGVVVGALIVIAGRRMGLLPRRGG